MPPAPLRLAKLYDTLLPLRHVHRFERVPLLWRETVAEHSALVAMLADALAGDLIAQYHASDVSLVERLDLDHSRVVRMALWHDVEEAITSDIPHDVKHDLAAYGGGAALDRLESEAHWKISGLLPGRLPDPGRGAFVGAMALERLLVKMADGMELILYASQEQRGGNMMPQLMGAQAKIWVLLRGRFRDIAATIRPDMVLAWYDNVLSAFAKDLNVPEGTQS